LPENGKNPTLIKRDERTVKDCINLAYKVYSHKALNLVRTQYIFEMDDINPNMMLRFDTRIINDVCTFRMGSNKRDHWVVVACGDGYLRVLNLSNLVVIKAIKGVAGNPTCIDIAKNEGLGMNSGKKSEIRDLIAVGYQDDSFVIYSLIQGFKPIFRGLGHRNYLS